MAVFFSLPDAGPTRTKAQRRSGYINPPRAHTDKGFDAFYKSPQWRAFRAAVIRERGLRCEDREHPPGQGVEHVDLDHIVELADGGAPLDRNNVLLRCRSCHVRKTHAEKLARMEREYWARQARKVGATASGS